MKIITDPCVYLVGRQEIDEGTLDEFLADEGALHWDTNTDVAAEKIVETAGRLCYMSFLKPRPGGNAAYTRHLLEVGHGSVLEHAVFNLIITGVSRSFSHELVRHRAGFAYSQLSQRYVDESDASFVVPPALADEHHAFTLFSEGQPTDGSHEEMNAYVTWLQAIESCQQAYASLTEYFMSKYSHVTDSTARRKMARQAARSVLPNATETKVFVTANARALRHFIEMRAHEAADVEIRNVATAVLRVLRDEAPNLFGDYQIDSSGCVRTQYRKV